MTQDDRLYDRCREAIDRMAGDRGCGQTCPGDDDVWRVGTGEAGAEATRRVLDAAAGCPGCAARLRLAREFAAEAGAVPASSGRRRWLVGVSVAAALLLAALVIPWNRTTLPEPTLRSRPGAPLEALVATDAVLPRDALELRWTSGPEGAGYDLEITDPSFETVLRVRGLDVPAYRIPPEDVATIADGSPLLWRVEVVLPDGTRVPSSAFRVVVGPADPADP